MKNKLSIKKLVTFVLGTLVFGISFGQVAPAPKIEVKQIDAQKAVVIKLKVTAATIVQQMGEAYGKLFSYLGTNSIQPAGSPFSVYYEFNPQGDIVFEAGIPISAAVKGSEEIIYKEFAAMKVVSTLYIGPYEKEAPIYDMLHKYLKDNNLDSTGTPWEVYLTNPAQETDPSKYQTLIYFPLKSK